MLLASCSKKIAEKKLKLLKLVFLGAQFIAESFMKLILHCLV